MQYIVNSGFVSFASSLNIAILALMTTSAMLPRAWILHGIVGLFGILFNCYVFLHSKRRLGFLTEAVKFQPSIEICQQMLMSLKINIEAFIDTTLKAVLEFLNQQPRMEFLTSYLDPTRTKKARTTETTLLVNDKVFKSCTPDMTSSRVIKPVKSQSDPLSRTKLSIKEKYLTAKSPELFKNKIYLNRRNLTNAL